MEVITGPRIDAKQIERYLRDALGRQVTLQSVKPLGRPGKDESGKTYGYGEPLKIEYRERGGSGGASRAAVLHTMRPSPFGHEHIADRVQSLVWSYHAFARLPRHTQPLDVGGIRTDGSLFSIATMDEPFLLTAYAQGNLYAEDLRRLELSFSAQTLDLERCDALCAYLAEIHRVKSSDSGLYVRRIRDLVGHGECIMGICDSYAGNAVIPAARLESIERDCVSWRWKLKPLTHRLSQVHGDFHPWNILFSTGAEFSVLDRSRGEWGEPADDVTAITVNYLFFSLRQYGHLEGQFKTLWDRFWTRYLDRTGDREMLRVVAPFFAFRCLVLASPVWYPDLTDSVRRKLMSFVQSVLAAEEFDIAKVNDYCEAHR